MKKPIIKGPKLSDEETNFVVDSFKIFLTDMAGMDEKSAKKLVDNNKDSIINEASKDIMINDFNIN